MAIPPSPGTTCKPIGISFPWVVVVACLFVSHPNFGQTDSIKIHHLNARALSLFLSQPDTSILVAGQAREWAIHQNVLFEEAFSCYALSRAHWVKTNFLLSTDYGYKALKYFENSKYENQWGETLNSLGRTFLDLKDDSMARIMFKKAMFVAGNANDEELLNDSRREYSLLMLNEKKYDSAVWYVENALAYYQKVKDTLNASICFGRKARLYFEQGDYEKSMAFNRRSMLLDSLVHNRRALGIAYQQAARLAYTFNRFDSALYYANKAMKHHEAVGNVVSLIRSHELLLSVFEAKHNMPMVVDELKKINQLKDRLYGSERDKRIQEVQLLYNLESKDRIIRNLAQENQLANQKRKGERLLTIYLLVSVVLLILLILVMWRLRIIQTKANSALAANNKAIEMQKEEMQAQAESLQQLNQLKSKLFSVISHDLRGPLSNLLSLLELLSNSNIPQDEFVKVANKLKSNLHVTQRTLDNLLQWSLSQMEGIKTDFKEIEVQGLMTDVARLLEETANEKNILIEINSQNLKVSADGNQIQLVLRNLLHNAIKFSKPQGKIELQASAEDSHCVISVKDYGIGMTEEEIKLISKSYGHFTKSGTRQEKGTGLGLILCKEFVHRHGGSIKVSSAPGTGTEFSFTLPLAS